MEELRHFLDQCEVYATIAGEKEEPVSGSIDYCLQHIRQGLSEGEKCMVVFTEEASWKNKSYSLHTAPKGLCSGLGVKSLGNVTGADNIVNMSQQYRGMDMDCIFVVGDVSEEGLEFEVYASKKNLRPGKR